MPRKAAHSRKGVARTPKKALPGDEIKPEEEKPSRKAKDDSAEGERARRSSTAAQTAASVAESRSTRTRTRRDSSSPTDSHRTSGRDTDSSRVRSSRRAANRINYKESDGEEEVPATKNDDDFDSDVEFNDSDSDEKSKIKKATRSPPKKVTPAKSRGRGRTAGAGRGRKPGKRKAVEEVLDEDKEVADDVDQSEDSAEVKIEDVGDSIQKAKKNETNESVTGARKSSRATKVESGRKSSRAVKEPAVSKRPSRNAKVKKYTEVDEDFDEEVKSGDEGESKPVEKDVKSSSRKRKRESELESNKKPRKEEQPASVPTVTETEPFAPKENKDEDKMEDRSSDDHMEIDESISEEDKEDELKQSSLIEKDSQQSIEPTVASQNTGESKSVQNSKDSQVEKTETSTLESNHVKSDDSTQKSVDEVLQKEDLPPSDKGPSVIKSIEKDLPKSNIEEYKEDNNKTNCIRASPKQSLQENTFLSKDQVNGESDKSVIKENDCSAEKTHFQYQNSSPPKTNGSRGDNKQTYTNEQEIQREYVENPFAVNLVREQNENAFLRFGFVSCNLSLTAIHKEKLVHELDKQAGIICLQNVSKSLFYDVLESSFDALGFKAVVTWVKESDFGLATFYKTSILKLTKTVEMPLQNLIQKKLESSDLQEHEKSAFSGLFEKCGNVLFTQLASVYEDHKVCLTVANVNIPYAATTLRALQVACVTQELAVLTEQHLHRALVCGEFNILESDCCYQVLRHGKANEQVLEDLKSRSDAIENVATVKLLGSIAQQPSIQLSSCYVSVLGREVTIPESKTTLPEYLLVSGTGIHTTGVLDVPANYTERRSQGGQIPLKADLAVGLLQKEAA